MDAPLLGSKRHPRHPRSAALILGAGWSRAAGLPLAGELFDQPPKDLLNWASFMAREVPSAYRQWRLKNADAPTEQFVGRVYAKPFPLELPHSHFPFHSLHDPQLQLPEPSEPCFRTWRLWWADMVEYLQLRLAWPLEPLRWASELRYKPLMLRAPRCAAQIAAIDDCLRRHEVSGIVTTNYDISAEQVLGVKPTQASPGFNYGDFNCIYRPPNTPFAREREGYEHPIGSIRMSKLHGSLNWSLDESERVEVYCDLRAAFRRRRTAAIIPPLPEKQVPHWLSTAWEDAFDTLARADAWIVIGYSLPAYDFEVRRLFSAASQGQRIEIWDPNASAVATSFAEVAPSATFDLRKGLTPDQPMSLARRGPRRRPRLGGPSRQWGGKDSNLRPTDYESSRKPSIETNLA
jgi:hypothetical protein